MEGLVNTIIAVIRLTGLKISDDQIEILDRGCPHKQPTLPTGKMGIYIFNYNGRFLKIGKAGTKSNARFSSQPYNPNSSQSNLAKSILNDDEMEQLELDEKNIKNWILGNTRRIDILLDGKLSIFVLTLVEAFLHCKYQPEYEGFKSQRRYI